MPPSGGLVCLCTTIDQCRSTVLLFNATFGPWLDYLAITKYSCLFGSLCRKLLQWNINERNQFRLAVMLFGYPYQLIQFSFFEKKTLLVCLNRAEWIFSYNSCPKSGQLATVNLTTLSNFISRSSLCFPVHLWL